MKIDRSSNTVKPRLKASLNLKVCLFTLLLLPLLLWLGFWQLDRADEKRTIQQFAERQQALPPQSIANIANEVEEVEGVLYRRAQAFGRFETNRYWLVENRTFQGRNGFHVLAPFYVNTGQVLVVNLGWVQGTGYREHLPELSVPTDQRLIVGQLVKPSINALLKQAQSDQMTWPKTILQAELATMEADFGQSLLPWILQIDTQDTSAFLARWTVVNVSVEKHLGYAYQWFAMALALFILTIFANTNMGAVISSKK